MLRSLIHFSLQYASLVLLAALLLVGFAAWRLPDMRVDVFPDLNAPTVVVMTEAEGLAADEVEQYVSFPIETAVNGMPQIRRLRSASAIGLSIVWVDLEWGADLYRARQLVGERLDSVRDQLPTDAEPFITPITSIAGEIMLISLSSPTGEATPMQLREFAEFDLRNLLLAVPGVAQVVAIGGELPEYQVHVDPDRLRMHGVSMEDIVEAAGGAHSTAAAGYLPNVDNLELPIRQQSRVRSVDDIIGTVVRHSHGTPLTIGQLANVQRGPALQRGQASENGIPAVILSIQKSPGTNTLSLTRRVDAALAQVTNVLPQGMVLNQEVFRQSNFIDRAIGNVTSVLVEAVIVVSLVLLLFLMNIRTTIIILTAIPVSLAATLVIMDAANMSLNVMALGGLAIAIGVLVDDAIIDVENVYRRLRENQRSSEDQRRPLVQVIFNASNEIRPAMVFATVIIVMVFVPLLFLQGLEGRFFRPLALTYMISILASLLVALTLTPALCRVRLRHRISERQRRDTPVVRWLKRRYEPLLQWAIRVRHGMITGALTATVAALVLASTFGTSFLPTFNEGTFTVFLMSPPGTSLAESDRVANRVEQRMAMIEGVETIARRSGRAERDEHAEPVSNSEIEVTIADQADAALVRARLDEVLAAVPGVTTMVGQPIEHRLSHLLSGTPAAIAINIYGDDLPGLRRVAQQVEEALRDVPGTREVNANREMLITSLPIRYRAAELASYGLRPADAAEQVRHAIHGEVVDTVNEGIRQYDVVVRLDPARRQTVEQIRDLLLTGRDGAVLRLRDVADVGPQQSSNLIARENARRKAVVSLNVADETNLGDLVAAVRKQVDPIVQRAGYSVTYGGQFEAQQAASRTILITGLVIAVIMLMLLQISTGSLRAALLVMINLPLALIGGIVAVFVTEGGGGWANVLTLLGLDTTPSVPVISIASLVGFITLFGISVRNGILLINHYNYLMDHEGLPRHEAIIRGSHERLVPILMTAIASAMGLFPLALAAGQPGSELLAPLATITLGGLVTSTLLNLIVVPAGFSLLARQVDPTPANQAADSS